MGGGKKKDAALFLCDRLLVVDDDNSDLVLLVAQEDSFLFFFAPKLQFYPGDKKHGAPKSAPIFFCFLAFLAEMFLNEGVDFFACFLNNRPTQARSAGFF